MSFRPADLAGTWYPASAAACEKFFREAPRPSVSLDSQEWVGAIVPHAGWVYSGKIAFGALSLLKEKKPNADLILLFAGHLAKNHAPRLLIEGGYETPFGVLETPADLAQDVAMAFECDLETPDEYYDDNAVEVQMPMLKYLWPNAKMLCVGVPPTELAQDIGRDVLALAKKRGFKDVVIVGSTDLTHYGPNYAYQPHGRGRAGHDWVTKTNDPHLIEPMTELSWNTVLWIAERERNACCAGAVAATLVASKIAGAKRGIVTEYATSYQVLPREPEPTSFVGYVGMVLG